MTQGSPQWGARKNRYLEILFGSMKKMLRTTYDILLIDIG